MILANRYLKTFVLVLSILLFVYSCKGSETTGPIQPPGGSPTVQKPPKVTQVIPEKGQPGTQVTVLGENFGLNAANIRVTFGSFEATLKSVTNDQIIFYVPEGATVNEFILKVGTYQLIVPFIITASPKFPTVPPTVAYLFPKRARPGEILTVVGNNFGFPKTDGSYVTINGLLVSKYFSWNDGVIKVEVPAIATAGPVIVTTDIGQSNDNVVLNLYQIAEISTVARITEFYEYDPFTSGRGNLISKVSPGKTMVVVGENFGDVPGVMQFATQDKDIAGTIVRVNGEIGSWNDTEIIVTVPQKASNNPIYPGSTNDGNILVVIGGRESETANILISRVPKVTAVSPSTASRKVTQRITIYGENFGVVQGTGGVYVSVTDTGSGIKFQSVSPTAYKLDANGQIMKDALGNNRPGWEDTSIQFQSPNIIATGPIKVENDAGDVSNTDVILYERLFLNVSASVTADVNGNPVATFSPGNKEDIGGSGVYADPITLTDFGWNWNWNLGNGTTSTDMTPANVQYAWDTTYTITVDVQDRFSPETIGWAIFYLRPTRTAGNPVAAIVPPNPPSGNAPFIVMFDGSGSTASPPATITSYSWDFGDVTPPGSGSVVQHTYNSAGTYYVVLTVTDSNIKTDTETVTIIVS